MARWRNRSGRMKYHRRRMQQRRKKGGFKTKRFHKKIRQVVNKMSEKKFKMSG